MDTNNTTINLDSPLVSVIVLTRNDFEYYKECISSVFEQAYNNLELVFCDDASEGFNENEIMVNIKKVQSNNIKSIKLHRNTEAIGIGMNYKKAVDLSTGEYIITLSPDKVLQDSEVIEDIVKYFQKNDCKIFAGITDLYNISLDKYIERVPSSKVTSELKDASANLMYKSLCKDDILTGLCMPIKRELITEMEDFVYDYQVNYEYARNLSALRRDYKIPLYSRPLVRDRVREADTIKDYSLLFKKDMNTAIKNEIMPFKSKVGLVTYLAKKFELTSKYSV